MGGSASLPAGLDHQQLFDMTKDTRLIMNKLLDYGLHKITVSEFVKLSSPEGCKNYVMFLTNSIHKLFYELQVEPGTDKRGVIFFRSIKDLTEPTAQEKVERQSLCLTLAYFYTRIFQIYGSIALTLIDDINDISQIGIFDGTDQRQGFGAPGLHPTTMYGGAFSLTTMGNFQFLKSYLTTHTKDNEGYRTQYMGTTPTTIGSIYFTADIDGQDASQEGKFAIAYNNADKFSYLSMTATPRKGAVSDDFIVSFGRIKYQKKGDATNREAVLPDSIKKSMTVSGKVSTSSSTGYTYSISGTTTSVSDYFNKIFAILVPHIRSLVEGGSVAGINDQSERDVQESLRLSKIITNLSRVKPLGHCIARGMQLLRAAPFDTDGISSICKPKFVESTRVSDSGLKTTVSRSGLPVEKLKESPGLSALSQLFYDTVQFGTPQVLIGTTPGKDGHSSKEKYLEFIRKMSVMFGDTTRTARASSSPDEVIKEGLDAISIGRDNALCKILGIKEQDIKLPKSLANQVYESVKALFARQYAHAQNCGAIIYRLFRVQRDQSSGYFQISLNPSLIQGGFAELNNINYDARELLMKYYNDCETTYLHGVEDIIAAKLAHDEKEKAQAQAQAQAQQQQAQGQAQAQGAQGQAQAQGAPVRMPPAHVAAARSARRILTDASAAAEAARKAQQQVRAQGPVAQPSQRQRLANTTGVPATAISDRTLRREGLRSNPQQAERYRPGNATDSSLTRRLRSVPEVGSYGGRRRTIKRRHYIGKE